MGKFIRAILSSIKALHPLATFFLLIAAVGVVVGSIASSDPRSSVGGLGFLIFSGMALIAAAVVFVGTAGGRKES